VTCTFNPYIKFELVFAVINYEDAYGNAQCRNWGGLMWFGVIQCHRQHNNSIECIRHEDRDLGQISVFVLRIQCQGLGLETWSQRSWSRDLKPKVSRPKPKGLGLEISKKVLTTTLEKAVGATSLCRKRRNFDVLYYRGSKTAVGNPPPPVIRALFICTQWLWYGNTLLTVLFSAFSIRLKVSFCVCI